MVAEYFNSNGNVLGIGSEDDTGRQPEHLALGAAARIQIVTASSTQEAQADSLVEDVDYTLKGKKPTHQVRCPNTSRPVRSPDAHFDPFESDVMHPQP